MEIFGDVRRRQHLFMATGDLIFIICLRTDLTLMFSFISLYAMQFYKVLLRNVDLDINLKHSGIARYFPYLQRYQINLF